jgi:DNA-binding transcriptional LysR family regulator
MGAYPAELLAIDALGQLIRRHPGVRCTASVASWRQVGELVLHKAADLGIADIGGLRGHDELEVEPVARLELLFYCRPDHPLLKRRSLSVADLESFPLAFPRLPAHVQAYRPLDPITDDTTGDVLPYIEVNDYATARTVVAASDVLGAATPIQIEAAVRSGELCALPFRAPWLATDVGFIRLRGPAVAPAAAHYMQIVREMEPELSSRNQGLADALVTRNRADGAARTRGSQRKPPP